MAIEATVCLIRRDGQLLLQEKAKGLFGGGKWDGPGGKMMPRESAAQCIVREVAEETGLTVLEPVLHGSLAVFFGPGKEPDWIVHVFSASRFTGELHPSLEGHLRWFAEGQLPYDRMWPSDRFWLPQMLDGSLDGKPFEARLWFDEAGEVLLHQRLVIS